MWVLDNDAEKSYLNCLRMSVLIKAQDHKVLNENLKILKTLIQLLKGLSSRSEEMAAVKDLLLWRLHPNSCSVWLMLHSSYERSFGIKAFKVESQFHQ